MVAFDNFKTYTKALQENNSIIINKKFKIEFCFLSQNSFQETLKEILSRTYQQQLFFVFLSAVTISQLK